MTTTPQTTLSVRLHTDSSNIEQPDHRLSVIRWKITKERPKVPAARCVSVPKVVLSVTPSLLQDALVAAYEDLQDNLIRSFVEEQLKKNDSGVLFTIEADSINETAVANYAAEMATSERLSVKGLSAWFDTYLLDTLTGLIAVKFNSDGSQESQEKVSKSVEQYRTLVTGLSAPKAHMSENIAKATKSALEKVEETKRDKTWNTLFLKVDKFLRPQEEIILESL